MRSSSSRWLSRVRPACSAASAHSWDPNSSSRSRSAGGWAGPCGAAARAARCACHSRSAGPSVVNEPPTRCRMPSSVGLSPAAAISSAAAKISARVTLLVSFAMPASIACNE